MLNALQPVVSLDSDEWPHIYTDKDFFRTSL